LQRKVPASVWWGSEIGVRDREGDRHIVDPTRCVAGAVERGQRATGKANALASLNKPAQRRGCVKVRYRGLYKNPMQLAILMALANFLMVRKRIYPPALG
jgi:hypothetical protein